MVVRRVILSVVVIIILSSCDQFGRQLYPAKWDIEQTFYGADNSDETVNIRVSRRTLTIAETIELQIEIFSKESREVQLPELQDFTSSKFETRLINTDPPVLDDNKLIRWARTFELLPFLPGVYSIPSFSIFLDEDKQIIINTEEIFIDVISVIPETDMSTQLRESTKLYRVPMRIELIILLVIVTLILVLLVALSVKIVKRWIRSWRAKKNFLWPHEIAIAALMDLKAEHLINNLETSVFYIKVSDVMRLYLRQRFFIHAPERTTEEIFDKLQSSNQLNHKERISLTGFFLQCDRVKFAQDRPGIKNRYELLEAGIEFIQSTKQIEESNVNSNSGSHLVD